VVTEFQKEETNRKLVERIKQSRKADRMRRWDDTTKELTICEKIMHRIQTMEE
jgi:hypothetical protein